MSRLVDFYRGDGTDSAGRRISEMWKWDDEELEIVHDYIQWMFPLDEPSQFNSDAPVITPAEQAEFLGSRAVQENLKRSFARILTFLGLERQASGEVGAGPNFAERVEDVWRYPNHNWLRITRILRSLSLLGLETEARQLYSRLDALYSSRRFPITAETFQYWSNAIQQPSSFDPE